MLRYPYIALIVLISAVVIIFKLQNLETVTITFLSASLTLPASILILIVYILGMVTGGSLLALIRTLIQGAGRKSDKT